MKLWSKWCWLQWDVAKNRKTKSYKMTKQDYSVWCRFLLKWVFVTVGFVVCGVMLQWGIDACGLLWFVGFCCVFFCRSGVLSQIHLYHRVRLDFWAPPLHVSWWVAQVAWDGQPQTTAAVSWNECCDLTCISGYQQPTCFCHCSSCQCLIGYRWQPARAVAIEVPLKYGIAWWHWWCW